MSAPEVVSLSEKLSSFSDHWNPRIVSVCNGNEVRIAKIEGDFTWHSHADSDELFLVLHGEMNVEFRDHVRHLGEGDMIVVPRGVEHRPVAAKECHILLLDREGEPNTGVSPSARTVEKLERI